MVIRILRENVLNYNENNVTMGKKTLIGPQNRIHFSIFFYYVEIKYDMHALESISFIVLNIDQNIANTKLNCTCLIRNKPHWFMRTLKLPLGA